MRKLEFTCRAAIAIYSTLLSHEQRLENAMTVRDSVKRARDLTTELEESGMLFDPIADGSTVHVSREMLNRIESTLVDVQRPDTEQLALELQKVLAGAR